MSVTEWMFPLVLYYLSSVTPFLNCKINSALDSDALHSKFHFLPHSRLVMIFKQEIQQLNIPTYRRKTLNWWQQGSICIETERNPDLLLNTHVFTFHFLLFNSQLFKTTTEWNYCHIIIHRVRLARPSSIHLVKSSQPFHVQTSFILLVRCYCYSTNKNSSTSSGTTTSFMHFGRVSHIPI